MDNQTEDDIKRLIDFLHEVDLDLAEFTVLTPFLHTKSYDDLFREKRIYDMDYSKWNAGNVVFQPKHMTPEKLQELYLYAWDSFYKDESQEQKMFKLMMSVVEKEMRDGTYQPRKEELATSSFGKDIIR